MNEKLKTHVDGLFAGAPQTQKILELKEELLANLNSKYDDLMNNGFTPEDAFKTVVAGIGDTSELVNQIQNETAFNSNFPSKEKKKSALIISVAVGLYIISPFSNVLFMMSPEKMFLGPLMMFSLIAIATGLLIYNGMTAPKYIKRDETIVEEFKSWKSDTSQKKRVRKMISAILWPSIVVIYLLISFLFHAWPYSWIIFIIGVVCEGIISLIYELKG